MQEADLKVARAEKRRFKRNSDFRRDPLGFVRWAFPWGDSDGPLANSTGPEPWQKEVLKEIGRKLEAGESPIRVAVASGHGVGKSALIAWLMLWAGTEPSTRGVVTANTETQLKTKTWAELGKWHRLAVTHNWYELGATSLVSTLPGAGDSGRIDMVPWSATNPEAFAGLHNKGGRVLLLFDEASAISESIWETAEGALTDSDTEIIWIVFGKDTGGRCLVPVTKFAEPDKNTGLKTHGTPSVNRWFARPDDSLFYFAGIWRTWTGDRGTKTKPDVGQHTLYSFLTTDAAEVVKPIHDKATPLILSTKEEIETWLTGSADEALALQKPAKPGVIVLLPEEKKAA